MARESILRMPLTQVKLILRLFDSPDKMGYAEGRSEGGAVKELYRKGYVTPKGSHKRRIRWQLNTVWFSESDIYLMRELARNKNET